MHSHRENPNQHACRNNRSAQPRGSCTAVDQQEASCNRITLLAYCSWNNSPPTQHSRPDADDFTFSFTNRRQFEHLRDGLVDRAGGLDQPHSGHGPEPVAPNLLHSATPATQTPHKVSSCSPRVGTHPARATSEPHRSREEIQRFEHNFEPEELFRRSATLPPSTPIADPVPLNRRAQSIHRLDLCATPRWSVACSRQPN